MQPLELSAIDLVTAIRQGEVSAVQVAEAFLGRIAKVDGSINAFLHVDREAALARAADIDARRKAGKPLGALAGLPVAVKDALCTSDQPTTCASKMLAGFRPPYDAHVVAKLRQADAVLVGKTNMDEFAMGGSNENSAFGAVHNPWDLTRAPGGSSGGAASALAAGISALEYGSDIGGSIRGPSQLCGVYGHKTSYAIVPGRGHALPGFWSPPEISVVGPLARSAGDLALALKATAGPDGNDALAYRLSLPAPAFNGFRGLRIAVLPSHPATRVSRVVSDEIVALGRFLARQGARVKMPVALPFDAAEHDRLYVLLRRAATSMRAFDDAGFRRAVAERETLSPDDHGYAAEQLRGNTLAHREWMLLENERQRLRLAWNDFFRDHDLLLCPGAATVAYPQNTAGRRWERMIDIDGEPMADVHQIFWMGFASLGCLPATMAPIAITPGGLPTGVQIIGPQYADLSTIRFASLIERHYHAFVPPDSLAS
jgi:amidase